MATPDSVRRAYDEVATTYAAHFPSTEPEAPLDLAMVDAFTAAVTESTASPRVLDAGCGTGRMSRYLADRGCRVEGVDLSPGMVEQARRAHPDLEFDVARLTELPHPESTFDGVVLWYSTIHTAPEDQPEIWAETTRVLRPGGHLLVAFQAGEGTRNVSSAYARFGHDVELVRHLFTADQAAAWASDAGLTESARLVRRAMRTERDDQAALLFVR
ncbi:class I SAM-dependent DNA methyltransferase [Knoellia sp. LjRoot47]|uniref:class I SAM-dependent DNA methyltransferase n=1 Tax=Knoellia sp. LjRoot47 TaxID=3342330 RepID=UPI003ECD81CF